MPRPDIVFCSVPTLALAEKSVRYCRTVGLPVIVDLWDAWPDHYLSMVPASLRHLARFLLFSEFHRARRVFSGATGISAISDTYLALALSYAGRGQCAADGVFPMGYPTVPSVEGNTNVSKRDDLIARYGLRDSWSIFTFVGSFTKAFDLPTLIEVARQLVEAGRMDIRFVIVGEGDYGAALRAQAAGLDNVIFTGWFDQAAVRTVLDLSVVGLAPYRDNSGISLPNKPFEYMAAGLPLLSSLHG